MAWCRTGDKPLLEPTINQFTGRCCQLSVNMLNPIMMTSSNGYIFRVTGHSRSPGKSPNKGQWRGALMFSLVCVWINDWVNNRVTGDLRHHHAHYDVIVMISPRKYGIQTWLSLCLQMYWQIFRQVISRHNADHKLWHYSYKGAFSYHLL